MQERARESHNGGKSRFLVNIEPRGIPWSKVTDSVPEETESTLLHDYHRHNLACWCLALSIASAAIAPRCRWCAWTWRAVWSCFTFSRWGTSNYFASCPIQEYSIMSTSKPSSSLYLIDTRNSSIVWIEHNIDSSQPCSLSTHAASRERQRLTSEPRLAIYLNIVNI